MDKTSLLQTKPVIDQISQETETLLRQLELDLKTQEIKYEVIKAFVALMTTYTKAYKAAIIGKSADDIVIISNKVIEKIDQTLTDNLAMQRDSLNYMKGKQDALQDLRAKPDAIFNQNLADAERIESLAEKIVEGEQPVNGKNWKPGSRPEKLSVTRLAKKLAKELNNSEAQNVNDVDQDS